MPITEFKDESITKKTLQLEVPVERTSEVVDQLVEVYRKRAVIPGFRKGHVPDKVVRKRFAGEIRQEALDRLIPEALFGALKERGLTPVTSPSVDELHYVEGEPVRFRATVEVRPPIELGVYRGIPVPSPSTDPTQEEVDKVMNDLAEPAAQYLPIENRSAQRGDFLVADIEGTFPNADGEAFTNSKVFLELGNDRNFPEINDLLQGRSFGENVEFDKTFEADFPNADLAGKQVHFKVGLVEIKEKQLPAIDDEFAKSAGLAENVEELRQKVSENVRHRKEDAARESARRAILEKLRETHQFEIPEGLVETEIDETLRRTANELAGRGVDLSKTELDWKKLREEAREGASRRVADRLILDAIAEKEEIAVAETELDAEIKRMAQQLKTSATEFKHSLEHRGLLEDLRSDIQRAKVMAELVGSAHRQE